MCSDFDEASLERELERVSPLHAELPSEEKRRLSEAWAARWGTTVPLVSAVKDEIEVGVDWERISVRETNEFHITDPVEFRRAAGKMEQCLVNFADMHRGCFIVAAVWPTDPWRNSLSVALPDARHWFNSLMDGDDVSFWVAPFVSSDLQRLINIVLLDAIVVDMVAGDFTAIAEPDVEFVRIGVLDGSVHGGS